uniref:polynucleotide adenylyltransferase n=1 Tax=Globodera pallida TaxID=36090 RepID=A0A183BRM1_GLOPA
MLKTLSGYRSILYIKNLLDMQNNGDWDQILYQDKNNQKINQPKKKAANFRLLLLALKLWAKNNYIYSNKFGYLNGVILTIMVTKIVLLYPNSTIPFLMEKFFLFYATRPFQVPIQLHKNSVEPMADDPFLFQNPMEQQMAVITPAFPLQNASKMVTHSTAKIIRRELIEGLNRIRAMKMENNFDWAKLLNHSVPFLDKYDQFIMINCMAESSIGGDNFCQFVDGRIRLQIVDSIDVENKENIVVETRLFPDVCRHDCLLSKQFVKTSFRTNVCKMWIVGIKLAQNITSI